MPSDDELARVQLACKSWPLEQQLLWIECMAPECGAPTWKPVTQYTIARVYSRYCHYNEINGRSGLSPDGVRYWIMELETAGCCSRTIAGYIWGLYKIAPIITNNQPEWLRITCLRVDKVACRTAKKKNAFVLPAEAILQYGLETVIRARRDGPGSWPATQLFRDGLFLVFGIYGPERLRALASITLDDLDLEQFMATYPCHLIKGGSASGRTLPELVVTLIREWVTVWRIHHIRGEDHRGLWIGKGGRRAGAAALVSAMRKLTLSAPWGYSITPHRLRDAAATCLVEEGPDLARLATILLGHRSEAVTREYTETATHIVASRRGRQIIEEARAKASVRARLEGNGGTLVLLPRAKMNRRRWARQL